MTSSVTETVLTIASDVLGVPAGQVTLDASPQSVANWDSVQHLNLVLAVEQAFDLTFEPEELDQMKSLRDVVALVQGKRGEAAV
jgi:acyl carrier protein